MTIPIKINDPRLVDFVLGELEPGEAAELAAELQRAENADARKEVEALREVMRASEAALKGEPVQDNAGLGEVRRQAILANAADQNPAGKTRRAMPGLRLLAVAATVLFCLGTAVWYFTAATPRQPGWENIAARSPMTEETGDFARQIESENAGLRTLSQPAAVALERVEPQQTAEEPMPTVSPSPAALNADVHIRGAGRAQQDVAGEAKGYTDKIEARIVLDEQANDGIVSESPAQRPHAASPVEEEWEWDMLGMTTMGDGDGSAGGASPVASSMERLRTVHPQPDMRPYPGGEAYATIEERPFTRADEEPLSTFSLHADSAAYTNIRRHLQQGQRPPKDAVRIEEMINYFSYDYPQPVGPHPFSVNIEVGPCPWAPGNLLAKIGLQGRAIPMDERPPANLVFLIDTSGSMNRPNRLPLVKESLKALLEMLDEGDRVGIVTYAGESKVALNSTPVSRRDHILGSIEGLNAAGSTHGSAGIQDAYAMAQQHFIDGGINRVILATDGDFNVGVTSRDGLLSLIEERRKTGVFLTVLGYGMGNLKDATLELLATKGNGNYAYIDSYGEARRILVEQLSGTLMTIAKDAKIQVEFNPARVRSYRLLGYENRQLAHRDFHDDAKDAGEIGAGHTVTALYQIVPIGAPVEPGVDALRYQSAEQAPAKESEHDGEMMFVKLRYKQPDSDTSTLLQTPVPAFTRTLDACSPDFRFASAVAGFGLLLRDSAYKGDATYDLVRQLAASALGNDHRRAELLDLVVSAKTLQGR